jgi:hypothetical protein
MQLQVLAVRRALPLVAPGDGAAVAAPAELMKVPPSSVISSRLLTRPIGMETHRAESTDHALRCSRGGAAVAVLAAASPETRRAADELCTID